MTHSRLALFALLLLALPAWAEPAKESTVRELIEVSQAQKLLEGMSAQLDGMMEAAMAQAMQGRTPTPRQQQVLDEFRAEFTRLMKDELSWTRFEPMYLRLYQQTFTQEEVVSMVEFYKTPGGQALISKMPLLMENIMKEMPAMMADLQPRMRALQQDFAAKMKAASTDEATPSPPPGKT